MPYKDPEKRRTSNIAAKRRHRARLHAQKYGPNAPDQRGIHTNHAKGAAHPRWNDDRKLATTGYIKVRVGRGHPLADPNGYAYEHLVVWCAAGNLRPGSGEVIHHRNENKTDNRIENLELVTHSEHMRYHNAERGRDKKGRFKGGADG